MFFMRNVNFVSTIVASKNNIILFTFKCKNTVIKYGDLNK